MGLVVQLKPDEHIVINDDLIVSLHPKYSGDPKPQGKIMIHGPKTKYKIMRRKDDEEDGRGSPTENLPTDRR